MNNICNRLKTIRESLKLTQQEVSDKLGLSRTAYANYEIGKNVLNSAYIKLICITFNVNEKWLLTGEGEMFTSDAVPLEKLKNEYAMSDLEYTIFSEYLKLDKKSAKSIRKFYR